MRHILFLTGFFFTIEQEGQTATTAMARGEGHSTASSGRGVRLGRAGEWRNRAGAAGAGPARGEGRCGQGSGGQATSGEAL